MHLLRHVLLSLFSARFFHPINPTFPLKLISTKQRQFEGCTNSASCHLLSTVSNPVNTAWHPFTIPQVPGRLWVPCISATPTLMVPSALARDVCSRLVLSRFSRASSCAFWSSLLSLDRDLCRAASWAWNSLRSSTWTTAKDWLSLYNKIPVLLFSVAAYKLISCVYCYAFSTFAMIKRHMLHWRDWIHDHVKTYLRCGCFGGCKRIVDRKELGRNPKFHRGVNMGYSPSFKSSVADDVRNCDKYKSSFTSAVDANQKNVMAVVWE